MFLRFLLRVLQAAVIFIAQAVTPVQIMPAVILHLSAS